METILTMRNDKIDKERQNEAERLQNEKRTQEWNDYLGYMVHLENEENGKEKEIEHFVDEMDR